MKVDILIKNGRVIDPVFGTNEIKDIAISGGVISNPADVTDAKTVIDAEHCLVTPGLIDFHVHSFFMASDLAISPEAQCFPTGVTTIIDAGSSGCANYEAFRIISEFSRVRQYAFLHVNPSGIPTSAYPEEHDPQYYDEKKMLELFRKYPDRLLGVKIRESRNVVGSLGLQPFFRALEIAEKAGLPLVCHVTDGPVPSNELVKHFRKGDVYTHVYHGLGYTILDESGHVMPEFFRARERGVLFDAANGRSHFSVKVAKAALSEGFLPDIISTDATVNNSWVPGAAFSLPYTMSRYLALGLNPEEIIACVTANPAAALHQKRELGSLDIGTCADVAIHRIINKNTIFTDPLGDILHGNQLFKTELTIREGKIVYRQIDF